MTWTVELIAAVSAAVAVVVAALAGKEPIARWWADWREERRLAREVRQRREDAFVAHLQAQAESAARRDEVAIDREIELRTRAALLENEVRVLREGLDRISERVRELETSHNAKDAEITRLREDNDRLREEVWNFRRLQEDKPL